MVVNSFFIHIDPNLVKKTIEIQGSEQIEGGRSGSGGSEILQSVFLGEASENEMKMKIFTSLQVIKKLFR